MLITNHWLLIASQILISYWNSWSCGRGCNIVALPTGLSWTQWCVSFSWRVMHVHCTKLMIICKPLFQLVSGLAAHHNGGVSMPYITQPTSKINVCNIILPFTHNWHEHSTLYSSQLLEILSDWLIVTEHTFNSLQCNKQIHGYLDARLKSIGMLLQPNWFKVCINSTGKLGSELLWKTIIIISYIR